MDRENAINLNVHYILNGGGADPDLADSVFTLRPEGYPANYVNDELFKHIRSLSDNIQHKKTAHFPVGSVKLIPGYGVIKFSCATAAIANKMLIGLKNIHWFTEINSRVAFFKESIGGLAFVAEIGITQTSEDWAYVKRKVRQHINCADPNLNWRLLVERKSRFANKYIFMCDRDLFERLYRLCKTNNNTVAHTIRLSGCIIRVGIPQKYIDEVRLEPINEDDSDDEIADEQFDNIDALYEEQNAGGNQ